jgi:uncharacterized repeat protein (TIGR02543 family)
MVMKRFTQVVALSVFLCFSGTALATNQYRLGVTAGVGGTVSVMASFGGMGKAWASEVSLLLDAGTEVQLTATADSGFHFVRWIGTTGFNESFLAFAMAQDWSLQACFEPDQPTLVITSGEGGTVLRPGIGSFSYESGTNVILLALANTGYRFSGWTGSAVEAGKVADPFSASTFVAMDSNYTLQANFEVYGLTLSVSSGAGGSVVVPGIGDYTYLHGVTIVISARAESGYHFTGWTGSAVDALKVTDPTSSITTVLMDDSYSVKANFAGNQHTLAIAWTSGGSVETVITSGGTSTTVTTQGSFLVNDGAKVQMIATADSGWYLSQWSGATEASGNLVKFNMAGDRTIQAYFAQDARTLVITSGAGGTVTQPGLGTYSYQRGTVVAVQAVANTGYRFTKWTGSVVDGNDVTNPKLSQTSVVVDDNGTLQANFEVLTQELTERWQTTAGGVFTPSDSAFIGGDAGFWALRDGFSGSSACGATPHRATILSLDDDRALMLVSADSGSTTCSDRISVLLSASNDGVPWPGVSINTGTVISFDEVGKLCSPGLHTNPKDNAVLPAYDNISLVLTDNNGNTLVYVLQRYSSEIIVHSSAQEGNTYREVILDARQVRYQRSLFYDFMSIPAFNPTGAMLKSIEFKVDAHGMAIIDNITVGPGTVIQKIPVYRFWSPSSDDHFYTASETEREKVSNPTYGDWVAESIAYFALPYGSDPNTVPVYRFWAPAIASHFYTISESEKNKLVERFSDIWKFEGVYFYAYPADNKPADAVPVHRFWSDVLKDHFYTTSDPEKDKVINMDPELWIYEGIAWYAYAPWPYTKVLDTKTCE